MEANGSRNDKEVSSQAVVEEVRLSDLAAQWQSKKFCEHIKDEVLKEQVLKRIQKVTSSIMDLTSKHEGISGSDRVDRMEWDSLYDFSAKVMDEYTKSVDSILSQLDQLYRKQYLWQESVFLMDSHTGATRIGKAEDWMKFKEQHLEYKSSELDKTANVIKTTIERLTAEK